jgi:hypothetical protein
MASAAGSILGEAVRLLVESRLHGRDHCALAELESYHQKSLPPDRQEAVAEHLSVCEDCTILLLYAVAGRDEGKTPNKQLEHQIEDSWKRLRPHLESRAARGRSLDTVLGEGRLSASNAFRLAVEISRALASLHASGRAHPDLRAENVLVMPGGGVRLLARGFAPTPESLEVGYGRPAEAVVVDLYPTLSPEQLAGEEPDRRSNLFSLGVLIYELLTGVSPFRAETPLKTAGRILSLEPAPASELDPRVPPGVSNLLVRLMAKEPADRPPDAAAVVRDLEYASGSLRSPAEICSPEDEIERLYDEIIVLTGERTEGGRADEGKIERCYARLRELQTAAARDFRAQFEASLAMPIDAGREILARARALREELEDLAARDAAPRHTDNP